MSPRRAFDLDPRAHHLNHGSFGAVTLQVQETQARLRRHMERDPMRFFTDDYLEGITEARRHLAEFVKSDPDDLVFVRNATEGVSAVLTSLELGEKDEILATNHEYGACLKACQRTRAQLALVEIPLPIHDPTEVVDRVLAAVTEKTRLVLISHVTSPSGLVLPLEPILEGLSARGVPALVDGAHAPGMLDLDLADLGQRGLAYYVANLHKWVCGPKGSAFLWVARSRQDAIHPPVTSHGYGTVWPGRTAMQTRFDWTGTADPTPYMILPTVLEVLASLHPDGHAGVRAANRQLALEARRILLEALETEPIAPESMLGSLAAVRLPSTPPSVPEGRGSHALGMSWLQTQLHGYYFRVPVYAFPRAPERLLRVSAHRYNHPDEYKALGERLKTLLEEESKFS